MLAERPVTIVLISQANRGRAQIAAGYLKAMLDGAVEVRSFGTSPDALPDPAISAVMREEGILLDRASATPIDPSVVRRADRVVTMGVAPEVAERVPHIDEDWEMPDPEGRPMGEIRRIRDEIKRRVLGLAGGFVRGEHGTVATMAYAEGLLEPPAR